MKAIKISFINIVLPLGLVAFTCNGVSFLSYFLGPNTRWIILLLMFLYVFLKVKLFSSLNNKIFFSLLAYIFWCFLTGFWSDVPVLSFLKGGSFFFAALTMIAIGSEWVKQASWQNSLSYTILIIPITLFAGLSGKIHNLSYTNNSIELFQGATSNPNFFGGLCAFCIPYLLWNIYKNWNNKRKRLLFCVITALITWFLLLSFSRSAIIVSLIITLFFSLSLKLKNTYIASLICGLFIVILLVSTSEKFNDIAQSYIYKNTTHTNAFSSRDGVWKDSYNAAIQGGAFGLGYGVSAKLKSYHFQDKSLQSSGYGREKGNSQLAIIEETGLIGLVLYTILLIISLTQFFMFYFKLSGDKKVLMGILLGAMCGFIVQSTVEAWWGSPAAPETIYFWTLFGVIRGVMLTATKEDMML